MPTDFYQGPGDFNLFALELITKDSVIDLREMFVEFNIFEDIFSPSVTGNILIEDSRNIPAHGPILGGELVNVGFNTPSINDPNDGINLELYVYSMVNRGVVKDRQQMFTIGMSSKIIFDNLSSRVSKYYNDKHSNIVKNIFEEHLNPDGVEIINVDDTKYSEEVIIPNWRPLEAIKWLNGRSLSNDDRADYLFYQGLREFNFKSLTTLYKKDIKSTLMFEPAGIQDIRNLPLNRISALRFDKLFNITEDLQRGNRASTLYTYDIKRKRFAKGEYVLKDDWDPENHLHDNQFYFEDDENQSPLSNISIDLKHEGLFTIGKHDRVEEWKQRRMSALQDLNHYRVVVTMPANSSIRLGDIVEFNIPSPEMIDDSSANKKDPHLSGKFLVSSIRHKITRSEHMMTMDLIKDSFQNELLYGERPSGGSNLFF